MGIYSKKMTPIESASYFDGYIENEDMRIFVIDNNYIDLRTLLVKASNEATYQYRNEKKRVYLKDLSIGLALYEFLRTNQEYSFTLREASDENYWIYLHTKVIPDLVIERWGADASTHIYSQKSRIWLYTLWWFVHIAWQGNVEDTKTLMLELSTDNIVSMVERVGTGYDIELYKRILEHHSEYAKNNQNANEHLRKLMVLNTTYLVSIEPAMFDGGIHGYVNMLISKLE